MNRATVHSRAHFPLGGRVRPAALQQSIIVRASCAVGAQTRRTAYITGLLQIGQSSVDRAAGQMQLAGYGCNGRVTSAIAICSVFQVHINGLPPAWNVVVRIYRIKPAHMSPRSVFSGPLCSRADCVCCAIPPLLGKALPPSSGSKSADSSFGSLCLRWMAYSSSSLSA